MGIPYYFYVLMKAYPDILHTSLPVSQCSDFFVDFNGMIHSAANKALTAEGDIERAIFDQTWEYLQTCISIVKPSSMVHVCTDGVAPIAKMFQQRKRRYLSVWKNKKLQVQPQWDRNAISPGTPFMNTLQSWMTAKIRDRDLASNNLHFYFSGADEAGEGEHKIFARLSTMPDTSSVIIHGLDADLIMLSLMSHHPNVFLMREPSGACKDMQTNEGFMYVAIDSLRRAILHTLCTKHKWPVAQEAMDDIYSNGACEIIETYVTLCAILGNDFLPHPVTLALKKQGHDTLLQAARQAWEQKPSGLIDFKTHAFDHAFLAEVFAALAKDEDNDLWKYNQDYLKRKAIEYEDDPLDCWPLKNKDPLARVIYEGQPNKWRQYYYKHMFHTRMHDTTVVTNACRLFIQGIVWVYRYYKRLPKDHEWFYPYNYAASMRDLSNYANGLTETEMSHMTKSFVTPHTKGFVSPMVQLMCIMPPHSASVLPKKIATIMNDPRSACAHMFPDDFDIQTYMKTHLWECTPILPMLDVNLFSAILKG
jgi:5'-3' exonuclease